MTAQPACLLTTVSLLLASLCALPCRGQCCGGPDTLLEWDGGAKADDDSGGDDSGGEQPLQSDRPGFGDCPSAVGCGRCQLELGYQYTYNHDDNTSQINHEYPQTLLRIGAIANWFEWRLSWTMEQETDRVFGVSRHTDVGSDDMNVGFKIALTPQAGYRPRMGLVVDIDVPTGSTAFTAGGLLPDVEWIYEWDLSKEITLSGVTDFARAVDDVTGDPFLNVSQAFGLTEKLSYKLSDYVQWHVTAPAGADTNHVQEVFEGGFMWLANNNLQLDIEAGLGLNENTPDYFVGTGLSVRR